jgi:hypothetical protein
MTDTIKFNNTDDFRSGSCLQGEGVRISFSDLVSMFGHPHYEGVGDKITTEWIVKWERGDDEGYEGCTDDGTFTIYDWHFARNLGDDYAPTLWNIGGNSKSDYYAFQEAVLIHLNNGSNKVSGKTHKIT